MGDKAAAGLRHLMSGRLVLSQFDPKLRHRMNGYVRRLGEHGNAAHLLRGWIRSFDLPGHYVIASDRVDAFRRDHRVFLTGPSDDRIHLLGSYPVHAYVSPASLDAVMDDLGLEIEGTVPAIPGRTSSVWIHRARTGEFQRPALLGTVYFDLARHSGRQIDFTVNRFLTKWSESVVGR